MSVFLRALRSREHVHLLFYLYTEQDKSHRLNLLDGTSVLCCQGLNLAPVCI